MLSRAARTTTRTGEHSRAPWLAALGCAIALPSGAATTATATPTYDVRPERIRAHVEFLADDLLEGRAAGTRGYDLAARYVAAQFEMLGLKPAGDAGSWFQSIQFLEGSPVIPAGRLELIREGGTVTLESAKDFLPSLDYFAPQSEVEAPLVFVGFGVHAPERGYDDYAGVDVRGRIAVVLSGAPPTFPSTARAHYSAGLTRNAELARRGAVGVMTIRPPWDERLTPWERIVQQSWRPGMRWLDADGMPANAFPELKRQATLGPSGAAAVFAGAPKTLEQAFADAEAGRPNSFELPGRAKLAGQTLTNRRQSANVVALLEGSDPQLRNEFIVLTAHLDGIGKGAAVGGDSIYNGAMDNASGIGMLLEVARVLQASPVRPKRSIVFLATTAEERGLLGADYFAEHPTVARAGIVANVNMDMPVSIVPLRDVIAYGAEHSTLGAVAARAAKAEGYALTPDPRPDEVIFVRSDQYPFVRRGIPALYIDSGETASDPAQDARALYEGFTKDRYHQPSDDTAQPIDYPNLAALARVNARITLEVANAAERPWWNPGDFFGETYGKNSASAPKPRCKCAQDDAATTAAR
jgi:hypothetical protein